MENARKKSFDPELITLKDVLFVAVQAVVHCPHALMSQMSQTPAGTILARNHWSCENVNANVQVMTSLFSKGTDIMETASSSR